MSVPSTNTNFSKVTNNAGAQFNLLSASSSKPVNTTATNALIRNCTVNNLAIVSAGATGSSLVTVRGYTPTTFSTIGATTYMFLNTTPSQAAGALAGTAGVMTLPSGAKIASVTISNNGTAMASAGAATVTLGYQATATNAAAAAAVQLMAATAYTVFTANSVAVLLSQPFSTIAGVAGANTGVTALSAQQSVVIANPSAAAVTAGGPLTVDITYYL